MVRISTIVGLLVTMALGAQASVYCQCLFEDGSHCCVAENTIGCTASCMNRRAEGLGTKYCNAGGKHSDVSFFTAQGRAQCK